MGVSTDGILAYGVDLGEEGEVELPWFNEGDEEDDGPFGSFESWVHKLSDIADPWRPYYAWLATHPELDQQGSFEQSSYEKRQAAYLLVNPEWGAELEAWRDARDKAERDCPIELVVHCSHECAMYIIAVRGTVTTASRGYPQQIESFDLDWSAVVAANDFCAQHGIPFERPRWLLASMWS